MPSRDRRKIASPALFWATSRSFCLIVITREAGCGCRSGELHSRAFALLYQHLTKINVEFPMLTYCDQDISAVSRGV